MVATTGTGHDSMIGMVGSTQQPNRVEVADVQAAISRLDFPSAPRDLAARVAERGDERVARVLARLPERRYEMPGEILDAVRALDPPDREAPSSLELGEAAPRSRTRRPSMKSTTGGMEGDADGPDDAGDRPHRDA